MALVARLRKQKKTTNYDIIILQHKRSPNTGNIKALIGTYSIHTKKIMMDIETFLFWINRGTKLTNRLDKLLFTKFNLLRNNNGI
jgi:ribosomal protein S16